MTSPAIGSPADTLAQLPFQPTVGSAFAAFGIPLAAAPANVAPPSYPGVDTPSFPGLDTPSFPTIAGPAAAPASATPEAGGLAQMPGGLSPQFEAAAVGGPGPASSNPGYSFYRGADGIGYYRYNPFNYPGTPTIQISPDARTATIPSSYGGFADTVLELRPNAPGFPYVPSFEEQIATVQGYIAQARGTGEKVQIGNVIYHPNGNIQVYTFQEAEGPYIPLGTTLAGAITDGLIDPLHAGSLLTR